MAKENKQYLKCIANLVAEQLGIDAAIIKMESRFIQDLGADTLDEVEMIMTLEEETGLEVADINAEEFKTVADVAAYLSKHNITPWE